MGKSRLSEPEQNKKASKACEGERLKLFARLDAVPKRLKGMVPRGGVEPPTLRFSDAVVSISIQQVNALTNRLTHPKSQLFV